MNRPSEVEQIDSREQLAAFIEQLQQELVTDPQQWENQDLSRYLEALAAWLRDLDGYYTNQGLAVPQQPSWQLFGAALVAAKYYE